MLVFGIILLLAGAGCVFAATRRQRTAHAMMAAETLSVPELLEQREISASLGAEFRKVCEVVGEAVPAPVGMLRSELAGVDCVWFEHRVQRRYKHYDHDSSAGDGEGGTRVTTRTETVSTQTSPHGWALLRDGHTIGVDHGGRRPDGVEQVADRFEPANEMHGAFAAMSVLGALSGSDRDETIGYQHTEWVLRPGTRMYVLGEVDDRDGPLVVRPPRDAKVPFVLSTRSEEELTSSARRGQQIWARIGAALAVAGIALAVVALVL
ncbi:hypothetical protein GCM10009836_32030 [Pseudonocardia ailaonensis]|uniref:RING-type E3 ubiquitin transferase n=1 Tax=Pseudonocardia ailaonensis TaxID=367279 RepID=A0ABN2N2J5_9PSEU